MLDGMMIDDLGFRVWHQMIAASHPPHLSFPASPHHLPAPFIPSYQLNAKGGGGGGGIPEPLPDEVAATGRC